MNVNMRLSAINHAAQQAGPSAGATPADPRTVQRSSSPVGATPAQGAQRCDREPLPVSDAIARSIAMAEARRQHDGVQAPLVAAQKGERFTDRLKGAVWLVVRPFGTPQHPVPSTRRILGRVLVTAAQVALAGSGVAMMILGGAVVPAAIAGGAFLLVMGAAVVISVRYTRSRWHVATPTEQTSRTE